MNLRISNLKGILGELNPKFPLYKEKLFSPQQPKNPFSLSMVRRFSPHPLFIVLEIQAISLPWELTCSSLGLNMYGLITGGPTIHTIGYGTD